MTRRSAFRPRLLPLEDRAVPAGVLAFSAATFTAAEGAGTLAVTLTRTGDTAGEVTVPVTVTGGTATAGADYTGLPATATFADGETAAAVTVTITNDSLVEGDETIQLALGTPTGGATVGGQATSLVTVTDDDSSFAFANAATTVNEGAGTLTLTVVRAGNLSKSAGVTVAVGAAGTATAADYAGAPAILFFAAGQPTGTVTLSLVDDALEEGDETLALVLTSPTNGATVGSPATVTVTIVDNDIPAGPVQFGEASAYLVDEAAGTVTLTVTRTGPTTSPGTVDYATAAGSAASDDYTPASGTLTFAAGQTTATITVAITQDALAEGNETFTVTLANPTGGVALGSPATATVTILNETAEIALSSAGYAVGEAAGAVTITLTRTGGSGSAAGTVSYATSNGTALAGTDYTATSGTVTFAAGQTTATVTVPVLDNATAQGSRAFAFTLTGATGELTTAVDPTATVTILDDETAQSGAIAFSAATYTAGEGTGSVMVTLTRTGGSDGAVSVTVSAVGGTAGASDYAGLPATATFAPGQTTAVVVLSLADDTAVEGDETVQMALTAPTGGAVVGAQGTATLTITDNDVAPGAGAIGFGTTFYTVTEGGPLQLNFIRSGGSVGTVTVRVAAVGGTVSLGGLPATVIFADGQTSASLNLLVPADTTPGNTGTVELALSNPTGGATLYPLENTATVTTSDAAFGAQIDTRNRTYTATENARTVDIFLIRTPGTGTQALTVTVTATGGTATAGADYTGLPATVTFPAGESRATLTLTLIDDNLLEGPETVALKLGTSTATLTIKDSEQLLAVGSGSGAPSALLYTADGKVLRTVTPFAASVTGGVRVATADVTGDGVDDLIVGSGPGTSSLVKVFDGRTTAEVASYSVFEASFLGGVYVAAGDMNGDGFAEVVVTPDEGGGPVVAVYSGASLAIGRTADAQLLRFFGIEDPDFRGGARAAVGDMLGDGGADLLVSAGFQGGPRIAMYDGAAVALRQTPVKLRPDFFAFEDTLRNGAFVALADLDGDGQAEPIFGGGPGGAPRVRVVNASSLRGFSSLNTLDAVAAASPGSQTANFFAGESDLRGGVRVAGADLTGDGLAEIVTGSGQGERSAVRGYKLATLTAGSTVPAVTLDPFADVFSGGVFVG